MNRFEKSIKIAGSGYFFKDLCVNSYNCFTDISIIFYANGKIYQSDWVEKANMILALIYSAYEISFSRYFSKLQ